jgi:hypothetical protein
MVPLDYGVSLNWAAPFRAIKHARDAARKGDGGRQGKMLQQPESRSSMLARSPAPLPGPEDGRAQVSTLATQGSADAPPRIPRWLVRIELVLRVMVQIYVGLALCYLPWSHTLWGQNPLFFEFPTLSIWAASGAIRGIVSGLGLLNLWIAFEDVIRHRDR